MRISFGKFIPVKVFVDGKEVKNNSTKTMNPDIKHVTINLADILSKNPNSPDTFLEEQQRRFFKSQVSDYVLPRKKADNKTDILPSTVKTVNVDGERFLVTGDDVFLVQEIGHELGVQQKKNSELTEKALSPIAENMTCSEYDFKHKVITDMYNRGSKGQRQTALKDFAQSRSIPKTLYISATKNENAKLKRDQYSINYIDFK